MKPFFFLCLVAAALSWPFIYFPGHFSYDEGVYLITLSALRSGAKLYDEIYYTQLPLFIRWLDWFSPAPGISVSGVRWVIWSHFPLFLAALGWVAFRLFGGVAAALTMFAATFDPAVFGLSHVVNGNIPAIAWATVAWALALEARKKEGFIWILASACALAAGVQFKAIALPAMLPIALTLIDLRRPSISMRNLACFGLAFALSSGVLLFLTGYELSYFGQLQGGAVAHTSTVAQGFMERLIRLWNYTAMVPTGYLGDDKDYPYWPLFLSASAMLFYGAFRRKGRAWALLAAWWVTSAFALLAHRQVWHHHLLLISPAIALSIGAFGAMALAEPKGRARSAMVFALAFTFLFSFKSTLTPLQEIKEARVAWDKVIGPALKDIVERTPGGGYIVLDQPYFAVATGRRTYPELVDPSRVRIKTGSLSCDALLKRLNDPRTQMVVVEKRFRTLECGETFDGLVQRLFPKMTEFALDIKTYTRN